MVSGCHVHLDQATAAQRLGARFRQTARSEDQTVCGSVKGGRVHAGLPALDAVQDAPARGIEHADAMPIGTRAGADGVVEGDP